MFLDKVFKSELEFDIDIFIRFFEALPLLKEPQDDRSSWSSQEFDNFRFFIYETFLYTITIGLKNEKYKYLEEIFYSGYLFQGRFSNRNEVQSFDALFEYVDTYNEYYNQTYSLYFHSAMADLVIKRLPEKISKDELINADLVCHYIAEMNGLDWFPITYIYRDNNKLELFNRLISLRHFEKVKVLFNVNTTTELQSKLKAIKGSAKYPDRIRFPNSRESVMPIYQQIDIEKIGTIR